MATGYGAREMGERIEHSLENCGWKRVGHGELFRIELPVVLYFNYQRLVLYVSPVDDGYYVSDDGETFAEYSGDAKDYFALFNERDAGPHYGIGLHEGHICKRYACDDSVISAIDEFIRFFILLDRFMLENEVV